MPLINHGIFITRFFNQSCQIKHFHVDGIATSISPGKEKKLLNQGLHLPGLREDGLYAFPENCFVRTPPAIQHLGVSLNDRNGCPQFMRSIGDKADLLFSPLLSTRK